MKEGKSCLRVVPSKQYYHKIRSTKKILPIVMFCIVVTHSPLLCFSSHLSSSANRWGDKNKWLIESIKFRLFSANTSPISDVGESSRIEP